MNIALFAYDFPHKKTQDFLFWMSLYGYKPSLILASPPVKLNLPKTFLRDKYNHIDLISPRDMARLLDIEYIEIQHDHRDMPEIFVQRGIELGVIAGARILKKHVIRGVPLGIINSHPGLIPENRGLNAVKWAVALDIPQGLTVHLVDEKVDRGLILGRYIIPVYMRDTLMDINLRIYELQVLTLIPNIVPFASGTQRHVSVNTDTGYHLPADETLDTHVQSSFDAYKDKWAYDKNGWVCVCGKTIDKDVTPSDCSACGRQYIIHKNGSFQFLQIKEKQ